MKSQTTIRFKTFAIANQHSEHITDIPMFNYRRILDFHVNCANVPFKVGHVNIRIGGVCKRYYLEPTPSADVEKAQVHMVEAEKKVIDDSCIHALSVHIDMYGPYGSYLHEKVDHGLILNVIYV